MRRPCFPKLAIFILSAPALWSQPHKDRHVVLISIDAFPAYALQDPKLSVPNLRRLIREGAAAERMITTNPTVTWPNHTSMVTGVPPSVHSVLYNGLFVRETGKIDSMRDKSELVRVPTVYDLAHSAGLSTAEVDWVAVMNAPTITWSFPERPAITDPIAREMISAGLLSEKDIVDFAKSNITWRDEIWTAAAAYILRKHRPNLMLFHLLNADSVNHRYGPKSLASGTALALADARVGEIYRVLQTSKLLDHTSIIVVSDHGFKVVNRLIRPSVIVKQDAQIIPEGGTAMVYLNGHKTADQLKTMLRGMEGIDHIVEPRDYAALGLPDPVKNKRMGDFMLAAKDGYSFAAGDQGPAVSNAVEGSLGSHGYLSTDAEMNGIFIIRGRGVRQGARLKEVRNVDIAPTIASLLGLEMKNITGISLSPVLSK